MGEGDERTGLPAATTCAFACKRRVRSEEGREVGGGHFATELVQVLTDGLGVRSLFCSWRIERACRLSRSWVPCRHCRCSPLVEEARSTSRPPSPAEARPEVPRQRPAVRAARPLDRPGLRAVAAKRVAPASRARAGLTRPAKRACPAPVVRAALPVMAVLQASEAQAAPRACKPAARLGRRG